MKKIILILFVGITSILLSNNLLAQVSESRAKALFIHQISQQIKWNNHPQIEGYKFGFMTNDSVTYESFEQIIKTTLLYNKKIILTRINLKSDLSNLQLVFIDDNYANRVPDMAKKLSKSNTLLVTFNSSEKLFNMINIFRDSESLTLSYEINRENLESEGFTYTDELLVNGGTLVDLKELYYSSAQKLDSNKNVLKLIQNEYNEIERERGLYQIQSNELEQDIKRLIKEKDSINNEHYKLSLEFIHKDQELKKTTGILKEQIKIMHSLEQKAIQKQKAIDTKQRELTRVNKEFNKVNTEFLNNSETISKQKSEISQKAAQINSQIERIANQNRFILLLAIFGVVFIIALISTFMAFRWRKQLNNKLQKLVDERTQELKISNEHFRALAEYSPVPLIELDVTEVFASFESLAINKKTNDTWKSDIILLNRLREQFVFIDANKKAFKLFETHNKNDFQNIILKIFLELNSPFYIKSLEAFADGKTTFTHEVSFITFNNSLKKTITTWILLPDSRGNKKYLLVTSLDITTLKDYENELKAHRDNLEVLVHKRSGEIISLNEKLTLSNAELNSSNSDLIDKNEQLQKQKEEISSLNSKLLETNKLLTQQKEKLEDTLSQLRNTQEKLIESEKMASLGMLTAGVAHEINNPINFISAGNQALRVLIDELQDGFTALLAMKKHLSKIHINKFTKISAQITKDRVFEDATDMLDGIDNGIERAAHIISSLNMYSYENSENFQTYNLCQSVDNTLVILSGKLSKTIKIEKHYTGSINIECYPGKINQAILNIISNAIDAITPTGVIRLSIIKNADTVYFNVADSGEGISEENMKKAFDPFFTTKEVGKGTGLGLYITYGIIKQHGGNIDITSDAKGTTVGISLPIHQK